MIVQIRTNNKGQENPFIDDRKFNRQPNAQGKQRWQCCFQQQTRCRAAASTMEVNGIVMMKILCAEHSHSWDNQIFLNSNNNFLLSKFF